MRVSRFKVLIQYWTWKKSDKLTDTFMQFPRILVFSSLEFVFEKNQTNSLTLLCDFPGFLYFLVLNLYLKKSDKLAHTFMRFPRILVLNLYLKKNQTNSLTLLSDFLGFLYFQVLNLYLKKFRQTRSHFYVISQGSCIS